MIYVSTADIPGEFISQKVEALAEHGVTSVELSGGSSYYPHAEILADLLELKRKFNLQYLIHNYFPPPEEDFVFNIASAEPTIVDRSLEQAKHALHFCHQLGAEIIGFHSGFLVDASTAELSKTFSSHLIQDKTTAEQTFLTNVKKIESIAGSTKVYFENNVLTVSNLNAYSGQNPFLLCTHQDYQRLHKSHPLQILLDVAHLRISTQTLGLDFESELKQFLQVTNYIHFSHTQGTNDDNELFSLDDPVWQTISSVPSATITLEIKGEMSKVASLYKKITEVYEK